jgi:hypothetical protein
MVKIAFTFALLWSSTGPRMSALDFWTSARVRVVMRSCMSNEGVCLRMSYLSGSAHTIDPSVQYLWLVFEVVSALNPSHFHKPSIVHLLVRG